MRSEQVKVTPGQKRIMDTVQSELFPTLNLLKSLLVRIQKIRIKFPLYSRELTLTQKEYEKASAEFFEIARKLQTPDLLFHDMKEDRNIVDYFQFRGAFEQNISEGFSYVEIIDRTLDRKQSAIQNSRTLILALVALLVSLLSLNYWDIHATEESPMEALRYE